MNIPEIDWDICRICLQQGEMHSIFETNDDLSTISDRIMYCSTLIISKDDHYPESICTTCLTDLHVAYRFRTNCESSASILMSMVETNDILPTVLPPARTNKSQRDRSDKRAPTIKHQLKEELPWPIDDNVDDVTDDFDFNDTTDEHKDSEIVYMEEEQRQLTQNEIAEFLEFIPEQGENREGVWSEVFKTDREGVEFQVMHVKPIVAPDAKCADGLSESVDQKPVANKRGPYKKGPKTMKMCQLCGNTYRNQSLLDGHMRRHRNERPFECQVCNKGFVIKIELTRHMRTHTGQKPYACKFCDRHFSDFGTRIKHERTHTGERPYKCELCPKSFAYTHVLSRHMLSHTGEKPYSCPHCAKKFTKREYMKTHVRKHHPDMPL